MRGLTVFLIFCMVFFSGINLAKAQSSYSKISQNSKIIQALNLMDGTTAKWAKKAIMGSNVSKRPMKIRFRNLAEISPQYANFDALGWKDGRQLFIFINNKHANAPAEAIASLLSHESVHQDDECSLEEETYAWGYEAEVWIQMKKRNPRLNNIARNRYPLVDRLNTLGKLFKTANYSTAGIRNLVYKNPGYRGLPVHSPGF